ncbi:flagellar hook-associated protein FlgK [Vreelandella aquamarina]|uniref:flagellar hook-associated protein FlgK n=1 Tax=Vreelandella aquamarina TaxID=77097 RepID=UPI00384F34FA
MSMFSIGLSGLNAAQNALNTTSNNISNVYTPSYNRELTQLGEGRVGGGVRVDDIERQFNTYVANQLNNAKTQSSALETYYNQVSQIDNLLADRDAGLSPLMQTFFSSLEDLASSPSDPAARQGVLGTANTLSAQFRSFDGYLQDMQSNINNQITDEITQVNNTVEQIAGLNKEIALARARTGEAPNSLLNQRDFLVSELNDRMDLRLNVQDGKTYNISLPNGQPLVTGTSSFKLEPMQADYDPQRTVVGYRDGGGNLVQLDESTVKGGALGGLMTFRSETLDKTQNQIGQLAVSLSVAFNEQHKQGVDLDGDQGDDFFNVSAPQAYSYEDNSPVTIDAIEFDTDTIDQLRATDYTVSFAGSVPTVTRNDSGAEVDIGTGWDAANNTLSFGGISMTFSNTPADGDQFEVQPVRRGAAGLETSITDLDRIAAGNLFDASGDMSVNNLKASSGAFSANSSYTFELTDAGTLTFPDGTTQVVGAGDQVSFDGLDFTIGELPVAGTSQLSLSRSFSGGGDNRNALAMQDIQGEDIVGGVASLSGAYGALVGDVGNRTNITQVNLDARQGLTDQLRAVQQSESGVNLDEEAANLIRYQQFYQANARVIDTAGTIMDTILNLRN